MQDNAVNFTKEIYYQTDKAKEYKHIAQALEEELKRAYMISK
jgi:hypothetical protein